jgi:hypothetical protein
MVKKVRIFWNFFEKFGKIWKKWSGNGGKFGKIWNYLEKLGRLKFATDFTD